MQESKVVCDDPNCEKDVRFYCSRCFMIQYCCRSCQVQDHANHKAFCRYWYHSERVKKPNNIAIIDAMPDSDEEVRRKSSHKRSNESKHQHAEY
jgi:hypothetical protein